MMLVTRDFQRRYRSVTGREDHRRAGAASRADSTGRKIVAGRRRTGSCWSSRFFLMTVHT